MKNIPENNGPTGGTSVAPVHEQREQSAQTDQHSNKLIDRGVYISTYGCQMNVNDTERMYSLLEMANYVPVSSPDQASVIMINACSVREKPVHKVFSEVGRYRPLKEKNPNLKIGVGGCVGQQEKKNLIDKQPMIDFVFGTDQIDDIAEIISDLEDQPVVNAKFKHKEPYHVQTMVRNPGLSTFVNITKGCDNFCTFCIVPYTRGREKSRPLKDLLLDIKTLVKRGVQEVTLLGQNVNSYKSECGTNFGNMLQAIAEETDIQRIRYTTSHPKDFDQELVDISQKYRSKICDYIHLPVQSGNSEVLDRMNRGYTREEYIDKVRMIQEAIPGVSLSTDIIVGFPGETEAQFEDTLSLLDEVEYETLFAFKYSSRPFTKAARFEEHLTEQDKSQRLKRFLDKHNEIAFNLANRYIGMELEVLVERFDESRQTVSGRSTQNKLVHFAGSKELIGQTVPVKVNKAFPNNLHGELVHG